MRTKYIRITIATTICNRANVGVAIFVGNVAMYRLMAFACADLIMIKAVCNFVESSLAGLKGKSPHNETEI